MLHTLLQCDTQLFIFINSLAGHSAVLDHFMKLVSQYGPLAFLLVFAALWFKGSSPQKQFENRIFVMLAVLGTALALAIGTGLGTLWFRPRPCTVLAVTQLLPHAANASFPSNHAVGCFALAAAGLKYSRKLGTPLLVLAALVAISRPYVGVHYPLDVLAGAALGWITMTQVYKARAALRRTATLLVYCCEWLGEHFPGLRTLQKR